MTAKLISCKGCSTMISPEAKACPKCGAPPPKRTKRSTWIILGVIVAFGIFAATRARQADEHLAERKQAAVAAEEKRIASLTPQQKAAEDAAKAKQAEVKAMGEAAWSLAQEAAMSIKNSAHDPASVEFSDASYTTAGTVAIEFRAKNGFGALVKQVAVVTKDGKMVAGSPSQANVAQAWNKHIAGKDLYRLPKPRV